ncbi:SAM-dependent methyltransferase [Streptomyces sp. NPDC060223]|uniref:SAM-dependent methyltransferase n=1 Tax=unclassified Streptomyces TaxID=2593676 RepID=UPI003639854A
MSEPPQSPVVDELGWTALVVAAARSIETHHVNGLISDPYAERFVKAADATHQLPLRIEDVEQGDDDPVWGRGGRYFGLRCRAFDDFLLKANHDGIQQVVLLGAGLDMRVARLDWKPGTALHEIDRPAVHRFKRSVLAETDASTVVDHHYVPADLEEAWEDALLTSGFDRNSKTVWSIEGVVPYLSADTETRMFAAISAASAPGSRLGYEILVDQDKEELRASEIYAETKEKMGVHLSSLFNSDARPDSAEALRRTGWELSSHPVSHFTVKYGRGPEPDVHDAIEKSRWIMGEKTR